MISIFLAVFLIIIAFGIGVLLGICYENGGW
jgi:hypothetical protein